MGRRKRWLARLIPAIILLVVAFTLFWLERRRTPDWRQELDEYVQGATGGERLTVAAVARASRPWNFGQNAGEPVRDDWVWSIERLPYPPQSMQCALLARQEPSGGGLAQSQPRIIFLSYHDDGLWRAGWIVHESSLAYGTPAATGLLQQVGCNL